MCKERQTFHHFPPVVWKIGSDNLQLVKILSYTDMIYFQNTDRTLSFLFKTIPERPAL